MRSKLRTASFLAKITNRKVRVKIEDEDNDYKIFIESNLAVSDMMKRNLSKKSILPHIRDIELINCQAKVIAIDFFPWGIHNQNLELKLVFDSGDTASCFPSQYIYGALITDQAEIHDLFPREIEEDEKEKKYVYVN